MIMFAYIFTYILLLIICMYMHTFMFILITQISKSLQIVIPDHNIMYISNICIHI